MRHKGEKIVEYWMSDVVMSHMYKGILLATEDKKEAAIKKFVCDILPAALTKVDKMMCGTKFICGDMVS